MITITTSDKTAIISNGSEEFKDALNGFGLIKVSSTIVVLYNGKEIFRDDIANITINGNQLTTGNYAETTEGLFGSSGTVSISDPAKLETPATNSTGTWSWGQLLRGIFNKIRGSKGAVSTVFNGIQANATSPVIDCSGYNAVLVSVNFTAGAGTGVFSFALQGKFDTGGVMMDIYDNNGNPLTTGNITTNQVKLFAAVTDFIQIVATEITDGATITVRVQPINI